jgi:peptidoglycan/xylan/chitin deacetylase (PgdA/CDA1 family)
MALKRKAFLIFILGTLLAPVGIAGSPVVQTSEPARLAEGNTLIGEPAPAKHAHATIIAPVEVTVTPSTKPTDDRSAATLTPTATPSWVWNPPGEVIAPVLLYHHIAERTPASRYFILPETFELQMRNLQRWGYTSIPISLLVRALLEGAYLPARPVVITFDDGFRDVYTNAFPILERYGFKGVVYVIKGQVGVGKYMNRAELLELSEAGWEIGSHSWTHANLRSASVSLQKEIVESRLALEQLLGGPVDTFAFPFGLTSKYVTGWVRDAGYQAAAGLGTSYRHTEKTLFYLSRIEVRSEYDVKSLAAMLPWAGVIDEGRLTDQKEKIATDDEIRGVEDE